MGKHLVNKDNKKIKAEVEVTDVTERDLEISSEKPKKNIIRAGDQTAYLTTAISALTLIVLPLLGLPQPSVHWG